jgi:hypothetical protein
MDYRQFYLNGDPRYEAWLEETQGIKRDKPPTEQEYIEFFHTLMKRGHMKLDEWLANNTLKSNGGTFSFKSNKGWEESLAQCGHIDSDLAVFTADDPYCGTAYCGTCFREAIKTLPLDEARNHETTTR